MPFGALDMHADRTRVSGRRVVILDDARDVWLVNSGTVSLFVVALEDGKPEGVRRHLFDAQSGDLLFGLDQPPGSPTHVVMASAVGEAELLSLPREKAAELDSASEAPQLADMAERWIRRLSATLKGFPSPLVSERLAGAHQGRLEDGESIQPALEQVCWLQVTTGTAQWLDLPEVSLRESQGPFPLGADTWLRAKGSVEFATCSTLDLAGPVELFGGLDAFHHAFLRVWCRVEQEHAEAERRRFQERSVHDQQVLGTAERELVSVLMPKAWLRPPEGTPHETAAWMVGQALGLAIRPPGKSEDPSRIKEPYEAIARASRLRIRKVLLRHAWWKKDSGPLLGYTAQDHYPVALVPNAGGYACYDPRTSRFQPVSAQTASSLSPMAFMLYRSLPERAVTVWELLQFGLQGRRQDLATVLAAAAATTLLGMLTPLATSTLIDHVIPDANRSMLWQLGAGLLAVAIGTALLRLAQGFSLLRIEGLAESTTESAVWDRLLNLDVPFFRRYSAGDLESRLGAIQEIRRNLSGTTLQTLLGGGFALLNLGLLLFYSPPLAGVAAAIALTAAAVTAGVGNRILRHARQLREKEGAISSLIVQLVAGVSKLQVAGAEGRAFSTWAAAYAGQQKLKLAMQTLQDRLTLFDKLLPTAASVIVYAMVATLLLKTGGKGMSIGTFLAFNTALGAFIAGVTSVGASLTTLVDVFSLWERARPVLEETPEVDARKTSPGRLKGGIALEHVTYRYLSDGPFVLDDVSLHAEPGEYIALVGPSGSGKSTVLRLLLGFEKPEFGKVQFDGQDLSGLDVQAVRRQLGVVLQHGRITAASLYENIASGALITIDEAWEAAKAAGFADDIAQMPMGMHTVISEGGTNLSGGQRQRLLIARALALKPRIILFDEATSALDNKTQAIISESLDRLRVTRVVVAHRLSTIRHADRIYVIEAGRVVQQGRFDDLAQQEGVFARLIARQLT